jgi:hypothetical protein
MPWKSWRGPWRIGNCPTPRAWDEPYPHTVLSCLHVILEEEWEHHRYAVRDLDAIEAQPGA